jgi:hypothetical protein
MTAAILRFILFILFFILELDLCSVLQQSCILHPPHTPSLMMITSQKRFVDQPRSLPSRHACSLSMRIGCSCAAALLFAQLRSCSLQCALYLTNPCISIVHV